MVFPSRHAPGALCRGCVQPGPPGRSPPPSAPVRGVAQLLRAASAPGRRQDRRASRPRRGSWRPPSAPARRPPRRPGLGRCRWRARGTRPARRPPGLGAGVGVGEQLLEQRHTRTDRVVARQPAMHVRQPGGQQKVRSHPGGRRPCRLARRAATTGPPSYPTARCAAKATILCRSSSSGSAASSSRNGAVIVAAGYNVP
jgi:hypothetical protein